MLQGGRFENSLISGTPALSSFSNPRTVGGISIYKDSNVTLNPMVVNCTIVNCSGTSTGGIYIGTESARVYNTVVAQCDSKYDPDSTTSAPLPIFKASERPRFPSRFRIPTLQESRALPMIASTSVRSSRLRLRVSFSSIDLSASAVFW